MKFSRWFRKHILRQTIVETQEDVERYLQSLTDKLDYIDRKWDSWNVLQRAYAFAWMGSLQSFLNKLQPKGEVETK